MLHYDGPWIAKCNTRKVSKKKKEDGPRVIKKKGRKKEYRFNGVQITQPPGGRSTLTFSTRKEDCKGRNNKKTIARGTGSRAVMRLREAKKQNGEEIEEIPMHHEGNVEKEMYASFDPYRCTTSRGDGYIVSPSDSHGENLACFEDNEYSRFEDDSSRRVTEEVESSSSYQQPRSSTRRIAPPGGHSSLKFY